MAKTRIKTSIRPQNHLINILKNTKHSFPNFVLLLGAGASKSSGVKLASEMVDEWRHQHFDIYKKKNSTYEEHLRKSSWYNAPNEYSVLFEILYDRPRQRREYIESCLSDASPSWGYIYLVNLLKNNVFNTVFTTNFDDLLNEACYLYSDNVRPIVCAHDSSITSIRINSKHSKIIKLHGDYLYDNIKNTVKECHELEKNMREKIKQYAPEFGMIVIGYSGNDSSIMSTFKDLLASGNTFGHGIYWCIKKGELVSDDVLCLMKSKRVHLIEIEGFDEFIADIHESLNMELQPEVSKPYESLRNRLNNLMSSAKIPIEAKDRSHKVIDRDMKKLDENIRELASTGIAVDVEKTSEIPLQFTSALRTTSKNP